ncbi:hypothetical protein BJ878DRAFT_413216 [Calycina marina]|uniref:Bromo domain-containing protein n=1 Tax=Calycina marina TaxID=1763456 RepID=A0A9P7ZB87_9HELO|nr:hypothetical protein BJ878DRAFT_413216 [Calycina marina]
MALPSTVQNLECDSVEIETMKGALKDVYKSQDNWLSGAVSGHSADVFAAGEYDLAEDGQLEEDASIDEQPKTLPPPKKTARVIDEDNYEDEDEGEDEDEVVPSSSRNTSTNALLSPSKSGSSPVSSDKSPTKQIEQIKEDGLQEQPKTSEDARKQLDKEKRAIEEAAKRTFHTQFYSLESDKMAMLEQQKLEESEQQTDAEVDRVDSSSNGNQNGDQHGSLSQANLGASSLTLKHLIARIDMKRNQVQASDAELRTLMNEVRKNRSKYASEEFVNQEELYEAVDKVLSELKAMTEYSAPFLVRVNKREAPDYYNLIKQPMDLGTMSKKLKTHVYKSKAEFTYDLDLIWANCLKYNGDPSHPLRRNAISMRKEADKLVPLIPDLVIRPRAEVEAEERRKQNGGEDDGGDDSDDEPIMSSRGRKTGAKGSSKARKTATGRVEGTPGVDVKPILQLNGLLGVAHEGSDAGLDSNGFATPPIGHPGSVTPSGLNGAPGSQPDGMDLDGSSLNGITLGQSIADDLHEDEEMRVWKQVTKKGRAIAVKERSRLFRNDRLNIDETAPLRHKAGMRRWLRQQKNGHQTARPEAGAGAEVITQETLAEGMEVEEERVIPDYYDPVSAIPDLPAKLHWIEDSEGHVVDRHEECLRMSSPGLFTAPKSALTDKFEANMRQVQETRKLCSKIGVIKQMQLQAQLYNNQFPKYEPEQFVEADVDTFVTSNDGPIMAPWVCKAALSRTVGKLCYHAGFEELQPSALDVLTDLAGDFFGKLARSFNIYREAPKVPAIGGSEGVQWQERFTNEEVVLHALNETGNDVAALESYVKDDIERVGGKLGLMHDRMKAHLAELLRPALTDAGPDGSGAFNEGSEQFVSGDFAEELGEDFFGFKALGLDSEFGMSTLSVPLHLINRRLHNTYSGPVTIVTTTEIFSPLPPLEPVTLEIAKVQIGLVRKFFLDKLHANDDDPLPDDIDLSGKQKQPKPRLGPTGKITSPRKRILKDQPGNAKKKKKLDNGSAMDTSGGKAGTVNGIVKPVTPAKKKMLQNGGSRMERVESSQTNGSQNEKDDVGMISPESIDR